MKKKRILILLMVALLCLGLAACGSGDGGEQKDEPVNTYTNAGDTYSIDLPGTWTDNSATSSNADTLILDNDNQTLSVLVQRYPRENMDAALTNKNLEGFMELYKGTAIKALIDVSEQIETGDVEIEGMTAAKSEEYSTTQEGSTVKSYFVMIESPNAYYSYTITGIEDLYDENIDALKNTPQSLKEKAAE